MDLRTDAIKTAKIFYESIVLGFHLFVAISCFLAQPLIIFFTSYWVFPTYICLLLSSLHCPFFQILPRQISPWSDLLSCSIFELRPPIRQFALIIFKFFYFHKKQINYPMMLHSQWPCSRFLQKSSFHFHIHLSRNLHKMIATWKNLFLLSTKALGPSYRGLLRFN